MSQHHGAVNGAYALVEVSSHAGPDGLHIVQLEVRNDHDERLILKLTWSDANELIKRLRKASRT